MVIFQNLLQFMGLILRSWSNPIIQIPAMVLFICAIIGLFMKLFRSLGT